MKNRKTSVITTHISIILALLTVFGMISISPVVSAETYGNYSYSVSGGEATITGFSGSGDITVPSKIGGYPVRAIGVRAFFNKASLTSVVIPDSVRTIADYSFMSCSSLKSVTIGNGVTDIGVEAFMTCPKLETLRFGNGLKRIGEVAFCGCGLLKEIVFPDSLEVIGGGSFTECSALKTVKLGKSVSEIGETAFYGCGKLNEITVDEGNGSFVSIDGVLYTKDVTEVVWCPISKTEIDLPESVTIIGKGAFAGCGHIKDFAIPGNVTKIGPSAFMEFNTLTDLIIPDSVENVGRYAFSHISTLKSVTIGKGLKGISDGLFIGCKSLTSLTIPEGVTEIGKEAFKDCSSLKTVTIPAGVTSIGADVFTNCYALTDIYFGGTRSEWNSISANASVPEDTVVHFGEIPPDVDPFEGFIDIKAGDYYAEAVSWAVEHGITSGTSKTTFSPNDGCTRGQVVTFLWRAVGSPEPKSENNPFTDIKADDYYYKAVLWAVEKNITKGTSSTKFSPSDVCTRGQIVTFLWRAAGEPELSETVNPFGDVATGDYFFSAVLWAVQKGITKGTSEKTFSPNDTCTRGQVVTFMFRSAKDDGTPKDESSDPSFTPDPPQTDAGLLATVEIYPYNDGNVAVVNVKNATGHDCSVKVRGTYKKSDGTEISSELKFFSGLSADDDNYFIFDPGFAFENIKCEIKEMKDGSSAYSGLFSFASSGTASIPANSVESVPDGYMGFFDKPLVRIDVAAPGDLYLKADFLIFDNTGKPISLNKYKGKPSEGHIDSEIPLECEQKDGKYILPDNLKGNIRIIVALVDISDVMFT